MQRNIFFIIISCFTLLLLPMKSEAQQRVKSSKKSRTAQKTNETVINCYGSPSLHCTENTPEVQDRDIVTNPEQRAEFPEGTKAMLEWIKSNLRWNAIAKENCIQGKVILGVLVEKDGSINEVKVYRGMEILNPEAIRLACTMPNWIPAKHQGNIVRSWVTLPVVFRLEE